jgi:hypothetical protein
MYADNIKNDSKYTQTPGGGVSVPSVVALDFIGVYRRSSAANLSLNLVLILCAFICG